MDDAQSKADERALKQAEAFVRSTQTRLDRAEAELSQEVYDRALDQLNALRVAIKEGDQRAVERLTPEIEAFVDEHLGPDTKSAWREYAESIALAIVFAFVLRGFVVEAFKIPTGSMIPTLLIGDHLFVNKFVYGLRLPLTKSFITRFAEPKRGEVVVFTFPSKQAKAYLSRQPASRRECIDPATLEEEKDFIKRIVAVAGDTVEIRNNQLILNGKPLKRTFKNKEQTGNYLYPHRIEEFEELDGHRYVVRYSGGDDTFGPITVQPGHVFAMGDNRDNSSDSRCWGQVPVENIQGRAIFIWFSISHDNGQIRWGRVGQGIE